MNVRHNDDDRPDPSGTPPLLNGEVAMMPHLVNGDAAQQVGALREDLSCPSGKH